MIGDLAWIALSEVMKKFQQNAPLKETIAELIDCLYLYRPLRGRYYQLAWIPPRADQVVALGHTSPERSV